MSIYRLSLNKHPLPPYNGLTGSTTISRSENKTYISHLTIFHYNDLKHKFASSKYNKIKLCIQPYKSMMHQ